MKNIFDPMFRLARRKCFPVVGVVLLLVGGGICRAAEFHVATDGDDANPGTRRKPFRSLEAARDAARNRPAGEGATIWIHGGRHFRTNTFQLAEQDGGTVDAPVVYRAFKNKEVIFDGGFVVSPKRFQRVTDAATLKHVPAEARGNLWMLDCVALGLTNHGEFGPRGFGRARFPAPMELFIGGEPLHFARWPNVGEPEILMGKVHDPGQIKSMQASIITGLKPNPDDPYRGGIFEYVAPRVAGWTNAEDAHIAGIFAWGFAEDVVKIARIDPAAGTLQTVQPHRYGFGTGLQTNIWKWHGVNLLEEIDQPGEYFVSASAGRLFVYPPAGWRGKQIQLSVLTNSFIEVQGAAQVRFEGLTFENSRADGFRLTNTRGNEIVGCTIRNIGGQGITMSGTSNVVLSCDIYQTGSGGVNMTGGDRRTLEPGGNVVRNCHIHHLNRWYRTYNPAVSIGGVGNRIEHNHLHHMPGQAVMLAGNDHVIEFNHLHDVVGEMSDQAAIYMGRDPSSAGNVYRFNFIHHTDSKHTGGYGNSGIFFDDGSCGQRVFGNVFFQTGANGAVKYYGGQFHEFVNNVVVDCAMPVKYQLWNDTRWSNFIHHEAIRDKLTNVVNIFAPPYAERYPKLARLYEIPNVKTNHLDERNYITTTNDPVFVNGRKLNFQMRKPAVAREKVPGFEAIPFERIGLYRDEFSRHRR